MPLPGCLLPSVLAQGSQEAPGQHGHSERTGREEMPLLSFPYWPPPPHQMLKETKNTLCPHVAASPAQPSLAPSHPSRSSMPLGRLGSRVLQPEF